MDDPTGDKEVVYENTYITAPEGYGKDTRFSATKVKEMLVEILNSKFEGVTYDQGQASLLTKELSESIREKVKELKYTRYKTVVEVTIGQKVGQAVRQVSGREENQKKYTIHNRHPDTVMHDINPQFPF